MGASHHHTENHDHDYDHCHSGAGQGRIAIAAVLTGLFMVAEVVGGLISGSLALLADAGHMMTDFAALSLAWVAFQLAKRPATSRHTFGFERFPVLAAFVNGLTLFAIAIWIVVEAAQRFGNPSEILAGTMLYVAIAGLVVNIIVFLVLRGGDKDNLNIRGAMLHVLGDMLGSAAAIIAALIIMKTGYTPIDPILSVFVALLILRSAWMLVKESGHILLQGAPPSLDRDEITADLQANVAGIKHLEHMHIWSLTDGRPMMTIEVQSSGKVETTKLCDDIKDRLKEKFHIEHVTLEIR